MKHLRQFVPVRIVNGEKIPTDMAGVPTNPHEPANWHSYETARSAGFEGVGFVLTDNDPYFCLDIDDCAVDGDWSPLAKTLMSWFPGSVIERSFSGNGLHVWGKVTGEMPPHRCKITDLGIELYHTGRFILIGTGDAAEPQGDFTTVMPAFIDAYFKPNVGGNNGDGWTTSACPEWTGSDDDTVLIQKALTLNSASSIFGGKATFKDLWTADADALASAFPTTDGRPWDGSSADAALAQRLAFWTGRNCERILNLMKQSALVREKWSRDDYLTRTILNACERQASVYDFVADTNPQGEPMPENRTTVALSGEVRETFLTQAELPELFKGCVYISDVHRVMAPDGSFLKPEQFKVLYGGRVFMLDDRKTTRSAWEAFTESTMFRPPFANSACFRPDLKPGEIITEEGRALVNTWVPVKTASTEGDVSPFLHVMAKLLPDERDRAILISYAAALVQNPGLKFQWAPVLQGAEGNGKSLIMSCVAHAVGLRYSHMPNAQDLGSKFNAWLQNKIFIGVEEIYANDKREMLEALKPLITNTRVEIQGKGQDQFTGDNRANFILCTNYKDAIPVSQNTRRYCIFYTAQQEAADLARDGLTEAYFKSVYDWLKSGGYSHVTHFLQNMKIADEFNPAGNCQRAPKTTAFEEAVQASQGRVEQEILEAIEQGLPGFRAGWVSSIMLDHLLEGRRLSSKVPPNKRRALMQTLGYDYHPALASGRISTTVSPDCGKPRLYVKNGSLALNFTVPSEVAKAYSDAQMLPEIPEGMGRKTVGV